MLSLHTNSAALAAQAAITSNQASLATAQTRLSTGYRINTSADDAAGLQIATRLQAQTSGMAVAMSNTQNSISMLQTADGSLSEATTILSRMKDLATQAADASSSSDDQEAMQQEFDTLSNQLTNIVGNTTFGGTTLFNDGSGTQAKGTLQSAVTFQIGDSQSETMSVDMTSNITAMTTALTSASAQFSAGGTAATAGGAELWGGTGSLSTANQTAASTAIGALNTAIAAVGTVRSQLGANENSLQHVYNNLSNVSSNTTDASGRIMDTDFAAESSTETSDQMLLQAGTAMLKQSNSISSLVISLLQ